MRDHNAFSNALAGFVDVQSAGNSTAVAVVIHIMSKPTALIVMNISIRALVFATGHVVAIHAFVRAPPMVPPNGVVTKFSQTGIQLWAFAMRAQVVP